MKKLSTAFIILTLCMGFAHAQQNVYPLPLDSGTAVKGSTFRYALSTTALKMTVTISKVQEHRGYYADFAQSLLGLTNVIQENKTYYRLENVTIDPIEVPDYNHAYLVELSAQQNKDNMLAKLATSKACDKHLGPLTSYTTYTEPVPDFFKNYSDLSYTQTEDAFVETKIIDGIVTQVPTNRTKTVSKTSSQKAQEAADAISKSRKDQYSLISGEQETPYSAETIETMLQELKQWENNYLSLFTGLTTEDVIEYNFYVIPDRQGLTPAFAFNAERGFSLENLSNNANTYSVDIQPLFNRNVECLAKEETSSKGTGYRYRKTVPAQVSLIHNNNKIHDFGVVNVRQLGEIQTLPLHQDKLIIKQIGFAF